MFKRESSNAPSATKVSFEGENSTSSPTNKGPLEGENPPLSEEANFDATSVSLRQSRGRKDRQLKKARVINQNLKKK